MNMEQSVRDEETTTASKHYGCRNCLALVGGILIFFPESLPHIWGNVLSYVTSYSYQEHGSTSVASSWTLATFAVGSGVGVNIAACVTCIGTKTLLLMSIVLFNTGIVCMYFALKYGLTLVLYVIFGIIGIFGGWLQPLVLKLLTDILGPLKGSFKSIICSGLSFGPVVINILAGYYMNPYNVPPTSVVDGIPVFDDQGLIDRVPYLMVLQGVSSFVCMFAGYCLLLFCFKTYSTKETNTKCYGSVSNINECNQVNSTVYCQDNEKDTSVEIDAEDFNATQDRNVGDEHVTDGVSNSVDLDRARMVSENKNNVSGSEVNDLTTAQTLKCVSLYVMWFSYGTNVFPKTLLNTWYKTFGLIFIKDDHFLIELGSAHPLAGGICRIMWGFVLDRFAVKNCLVSLYTFLSFSLLLMYFAPALDRNVYFLVVLAVGCGTEVVFPTYLTVIPTYFGEHNLYKVLGLISTSRIPLAFFMSPIFEVLRVQFGWFGPFFFSASLTSIVLVLVIFGIPSISGNKKKRLGNNL